MRAAGANRVRSVGRVKRSVFGSLGLPDRLARIGPVWPNRNCVVQGCGSAAWLSLAKSAPPLSVRDHRRLRPSQAQTIAVNQVQQFLGLGRMRTNLDGDPDLHRHARAFGYGRHVADP